MRNHYTLITMAKFKKIKSQNNIQFLLERIWKNWITHSLLMGISNIKATLETILAAYKKIKYETTI